jgi:hypothetical protein
MKQNSKFDPEVAKILEMMEKKNRVVKKRVVKRFQMSKEQYLKRLQDSHQSQYFATINSPPKLKDEGSLEEELPSDKSSKDSSFLAPYTFISRNRHSKLNVKKTALTLLMDKSSIFYTINDPSRVTFGNLSERKSPNQTSFQATAQTSRLPEINKTYFLATAKIKSHRPKPIPASVYIKPN